MYRILLHTRAGGVSPDRASLHAGVGQSERVLLLFLLLAYVRVYHHAYFIIYQRYSCCCALSRTASQLGAFVSPLRQVIIVHTYSRNILRFKQIIFVKPEKKKMKNVFSHVLYDMIMYNECENADDVCCPTDRPTPAAT